MLNFGNPTSDTLNQIVFEKSEKKQFNKKKNRSFMR